MDFQKIVDALYSPTCPGKFVFIREIKNSYRICSDQQSRSRGLNDDFYEQMAAVDMGRKQWKYVRRRKSMSYSGIFAMY